MEAKTKKPRLTWRKQPTEAVPSSLKQGPRGASAVLTVGIGDVASVYAKPGNPLESVAATLDALALAVGGVDAADVCERLDGLDAIDCYAAGLREAARVVRAVPGTGSPPVGWYWIARADEMGVPLKNTSQALVADLKTAKADCEVYVRKCLGMAAAPPKAPRGAKR